MHRMKAPTGKPVAYRPSPKTEAQQLRACHHSVLPTREFDHPKVKRTSLRLSPHMGPKCELGLASPPRAD